MGTEVTGRLSHSSNPSRATTIRYPDSILAGQTTCAEGFTCTKLEFSDCVKQGVGCGSVTRICGANGRPARKRRMMKSRDLPDRGGLPSSQRSDMNRSTPILLDSAQVEWVSWVDLGAMQ